ncbi:UNVERIFIED_CONTAM: hypothetical protein Sangu_2335600 [Sesamum angustifolium]|uniref:Uncharacterized protein n=1 Tax=Sesamum angustifolium TaxID=2727405 RepID=A0AAW2L6I1_9LAMI
MEGQRPLATKDLLLPLMEEEQWVAATGVDFALMTEQLRVEKFYCSPLFASAPPPREPRIILDFGGVKEGAD